MKKHFKLKHKILGVLMAHDNLFPLDSVENKKLHFDKILEETKEKNRIYLLDQLQELYTDKEIFCTEEYDNSKFLILGAGRTAYNKGKYKSLGFKESRDLIFDYFKIISGILLLLIALYGFIKNIVDNRTNSKEIEELRNEIRLIQKK